MALGYCILGWAEMFSAPSSQIKIIFLKMRKIDNTTITAPKPKNKLL